MYHIVCISENTACRETGGIDSYDERSLHLMTQMWPLYFSLHFKWCGFSHLHLFKIPEPWKQRNRLQRRKLPTSCTIPTTAGKIVFSSIFCFQIIFSFFQFYGSAHFVKLSTFCVFRTVWGSIENRSTNFLSVTAPDRYPPFLLKKPIPIPT